MTEAQRIRKIRFDQAVQISMILLKPVGGLVYRAHVEDAVNRTLDIDLLQWTNETGDLVSLDDQEVVLAVIRLLEHRYVGGPK